MLFFSDREDGVHRPDPVVDLRERVGLTLGHGVELEDGEDVRRVDDDLMLVDAQSVWTSKRTCTDERAK